MPLDRDIAMIAADIAADNRIPHTIQTLLDLDRDLRV